MGSVNKVTLLGRLGRDPEIKYTTSGQAVANFSLATDEAYTNKSGEKIKKTEWHKLVAWGNLVTNVIDKYVKKGSQIYVEGKLQTRDWQDKNGEKRYATEINVFGIQLLDSKQSREPGEENFDAPTETAAAAEEEF